MNARGGGGVRRIDPGGAHAFKDKKLQLSSIASHVALQTVGERGPIEAINKSTSTSGAGMC